MKPRLDTTRLVALLLMLPAPVFAAECELDQFSAMRLAYSSVPIEATTTYEFSASLANGVWDVGFAARTGEPIEWSVTLDCNTGEVLEMTAAMPSRSAQSPDLKTEESPVELPLPCRAKPFEPVTLEAAAQRAILNARAEVLGLAPRLNNHVPVDANQLETTKVDPAEDGGWYVTLESGACKYIVYSNPGVEIEVAGMSEGCIEE